MLERCLHAAAVCRRAYIAQQNSRLLLPSSCRRPAAPPPEPASLVTFRRRPEAQAGQAKAGGNGIMRYGSVKPAGWLPSGQACLVWDIFFLLMLIKVRHWSAVMHATSAA